MTNRRRKIGTVLLMTGMFLNPLGYAELVAGIMSLTGWDYWTTTHLLYVLAALLFLLSFFVLKINPINIVRERIRKIVKIFKRKN